MAKYFAKLDNDNLVLGNVLLSETDAPDEATGIQFLKNLYGWQKWKETFRNQDPNPRGEFASGPGFKYHEDIDKFVEHPKPYASWTLNNTTGKWEAPVTYPVTYNAGLADDETTPQTNPDSYDWDENTQQWIART